MEESNGTRNDQGDQVLATAEMDPIARVLASLQTLLIWIDEHRSAFEQLRQSDALAAETELDHLKNASEQAIVCLDRLTRLLLGGGAVDPAKRLPKGLCSDVWVRLADLLQRGRAQANNEDGKGTEQETGTFGVDNK